MNIFEILSGGQRVVALSDGERGILITWNNSLTLEAWTYQSDDGSFEAMSSRTLTGKPSNLRVAQFQAKRWIQSGIDDER